ncbi:hypothetical protein L6452_12780 [Arctium lappa]|uniref:Uncharacterized protein n=1 Tax=Arctium lappa TaxID=4217 RepID=A0ACB9CGC4_ARCLA|nr:hypothetical protein L6452_12780 [Arctium lappa]
MGQLGFFQAFISGDSNVKMRDYAPKLTVNPYFTKESFCVQFMCCLYIYIFCTCIFQVGMCFGIAVVYCFVPFLT